MLFHGVSETQLFVVDKHLNFLVGFLKYGNVGVEIFLFMSGICLYFSMKHSTIKEFYVKRLLRIWIPFILIDWVYFFYDDITRHANYILFLKDISLYSFWSMGRGLV